MLRRRVFLHPDVIAASRNFVNVRLNVWLDEKNYSRVLSIIGEQYSGKSNMANTVFCMFEPDAEGVSADSFPREKSVFYGSRVGRLYPICLTPVASREARAEFVKKRRFEDLGEEEVDPELLERILWERENGRDGPSVAKIMDDLAERYPLKASAAESLPIIPVMPDLVQAINFGAVDSRAVLAIVQPSEGDDAMNENVARLLFEEGIAGRVHAVRMSTEEWESAKADDLVKGGNLESGLIFLRPDTFGRDAEVQLEIPPSASESQMRGNLVVALAEFRDTWQKLDRESHMKKGIEDDMTWHEYDPNTNSIVDISKQESRWRYRADKEKEEKAKAAKARHKASQERAAEAKRKRAKQAEKTKQ